MDLADRLLGYAGRDYEIVDYHMTDLPRSGIQVRGPLPPDLEPGSYFAAVGAAQTFGCYCENPFPQMIAERIGLPALNLGIAGAGPEFFLVDDDMIPHINRARFAIVQVMSGRSQSNSVYSCDGKEYVTRRKDGRQLGAEEIFDELLGKPVPKESSILQRARRKVVNLMGRSATRALVEEIRANWVRSNLELLDRIAVPTVLFWFSRRGTDYTEDYASTFKLFGEFPQLVHTEMLAPLKARATSYVECVSARGTPQKLFSRFTGEPATEPHAFNAYYPSPEMHEDAADALEPVCRGLAARSGPTTAKPSFP
jgi:hypothetical protein